MGESAGGASILWQITAYGGTEGPAPFQQAIIQSPAWVPDIGVVQQEDLYQNFLSLLRVSSIQEARQLDSKTLIDANAQLVGNSPYGTFVVDPVSTVEYDPPRSRNLCYLACHLRLLGFTCSWALERSELVFSHTPIFLFTLG